MLVRVKEPPTRLRIDGENPGRILEALRRDFEVEVEEEDEEPSLVQDSAWHREIAEKRTPGMKLNSRRKRARLTLDRLAEKTGIAKSHLSAMENGKRAIGLLTAKKLAAALKCDYHVFV